MDANAKLRQMLAASGLNQYQLSKKSGLSESTLANIFKRDTVPTISTLSTICRGFGITLAQFFADGEMVELTPQLKELFEGWFSLTPEEKNAVIVVIHAFHSSK